MNNHLLPISVLVRSLYRHGVRHAVISPGSRSTPIAIAFAIHKGIRKQIVIDERSAGFIALGIGKQTGNPAVLVCTSGTAAANYMPAVVEARQSGVPMIIISADRPPHLRATGSSQTIDQIKLYGDHTVFFHEIGEPKNEQKDLDRLKLLGKQAVHEAVTKGGAVHLNAPFRKPLDPSEQEFAAEVKINEQQDLNPITFQTGTIHWQPGPDLANLINDSAKPLIIAGPANPHHQLSALLIKLASKKNIPVLAEPGSGLEEIPFSIHNYEQFLRSKPIRTLIKPDVIFRFGDQPYTQSILDILSQWKDCPVVSFLSRDSWQDHSMSIHHRVILNKSNSFTLDNISETHSQNWLKSWKDAGEKAQPKLDNILADAPALSDGHVYHHLSSQLQEGWNVMISNSFCVRDMAMFGNAPAKTFVNRGAAGIDGILSTAAGIHFASDMPTCCIAGDIAFLHDSNALLSLKNLEKPFVIIVVNNSGGTIFRMLPVHNLKSYYSDYFETPQQVSIQRLAEAHSIQYLIIKSIKVLEAVKLQDFKKGASLIEVKTDPDQSMKIRHDLWGV
ncbi:MAG: 2-succinyl-5-enolpyruvyl-6-hydroxy-3-cyclohexene-1-carboxylic-acid synthase [Balneolaceae bacterium]